MLFYVFSRRDFRENDQLITLFSRERGKEIVLARSVKKITSKNSAFLEPFFLVEAEIVSGKEIKHLTKVSSVKTYKNIRNNLEKSIATQRIIKVADMLIPENGKEPAFFDLIRESLDFIENNIFHNNIEIGFYCRALNVLGVSPIFSNCVFCNKSCSSKNESDYYFSIGSGGLVCEKCALDSNLNNKLQTLSSIDLANWGKLVKQPGDNPMKLSRSLCVIIKKYFEYHTNTKLAKFSQIS